MAKYLLVDITFFKVLNHLQVCNYDPNALEWELLSTVGGVRSKLPLVMCRNSIASDLIYNYHSSSPLSCMELKCSKNETSIIWLHNDVLKHVLTL